VLGIDAVPISQNFPGWLKNGVNALQGAKWESGLDNSPMYDSAVFDTTRHLMMMADVGLMSLYITDCKSLAQIAGVLGKRSDERELLGRAAKYTRSLETLWDERRGSFSIRISSPEIQPQTLPDAVLSVACRGRHRIAGEQDDKRALFEQT